MSSDLITSTMKSEPARPAIGFTSLVTLASSAIWCAVGRNARGVFAGLAGGDAASATLVAVVGRAPAPATPFKNLRRLTSGRRFFRAIINLPFSHAAAWAV